MIKGITRASVNMVERYLPDAFVLVLVLTLVVFGAGMLVEGHGPVAMAEFWGDGFWNLLSFSMQMVLILVSGFVVASTPVFKRLLQALAKLARSPGQGIVLVTVVSLIAAWVNWGFGLVIGALFARELARCLPNLDYRLAIASAYSGFMVWHGGLSGSIPLVIATEGHFTAEMIGIIPTSETIFSVMNLGILLALLIVIPLVNWLITPAAGDAVTVDPAKLIDEEPNSEEVADTPSTRLENSMILSLISGLLGILYVGYYIFGTDGGLNLNIVNFTLIFAGILLHGRPSQFLTSVKKAVNGASGIIVQFPFYAGIMGMMVGSGLAVTLSEAFVSISSAETLPFFTFLSAGIVNMFVPSGGGQWAVQAPIMLEASAALGVSPARTAMAVAWGDTWTNLVQPFWALPALAIAGLSAKDIMGYCLIVLVVTGVVLGLGLTFLP
ncbi:short-chain fatty acids transporter [Mameliella alba]|uniref:short-chain fatty acid transporter n=1 Tax=Mameliella alba TaxID=561184 RepID=UPI00087E926E|nr:short-chain fatty acid transporter [Mameliella alba]PTR39384.1 short-chain fatty acids transporter [Mameliella alba]BBU54376.1 short-chain fatty acids transporter [Mameliella alba]GGF65505.1 short-chain fatty acids transporter [Mameliella alba]SDD32870.1 short-chain fatty acids transporter [Mameliella alba]